MTDPFDVADEQEEQLMSRATDLSSGREDAVRHEPPSPRPGKQACPYCGSVNDRTDEPQLCPKCTMEDTPATRAATKARIGPWYVMQSRNPSAPGMKWATMLSLVAKGQVTPRSIVRGPTTHQLWKFAAHVKGLSREFGMCYSCGGEIDHGANQCPYCQRLQEPPINADALLETREPLKQPVHRELKMAETSSGNAGAAPVVWPPQSPAPSPAAPTAGRNREQHREPPADEPRTEWHPDPGILSAKELAAAFQLDFTPSTGPSRPRRVARTFALLLLLAAIGFGAVLYVK